MEAEVELQAFCERAFPDDGADGEGEVGSRVFDQVLEVGSEDEAPRDEVVVGAAVELSSHGEEANVVFCSLGSLSQGLSRLRSCVRQLTVRRLIIRCRLVTLDPADRAVEVRCHFFDLRELVCSVRGHAR